MFNYFSKYGKITEFQIIFDKKTGGSRGFGFIVFDKIKSVEMVLKNKNSHSINGKWIDCKPSTKEDDDEFNLSNEEDNGIHLLIL
jgi:RNA recognition motif-containing protein